MVDERRRAAQGDVGERAETARRTQRGVGPQQVGSGRAGVEPWDTPAPSHPREHRAHCGLAAFQQGDSGVCERARAPRALAHPAPVLVLVVSESQPGELASLAFQERFGGHMRAACTRGHPRSRSVLGGITF